ncbi:hypothetical protein ACFWDN_13160 [Micromonospora chalcea]
MTRSRYNHIRLILDEHGSVLEANPSGCEYGMVQPGDVIVQAPLTDEQRARIGNLADRQAGKPYNFLDVVALGLSQFGFKPAWAWRRIGNPRTLFCSQLVDYVWELAGFHAFDDGRQHHDVSPGDVADLAFTEGWEIERGASVNRDYVWV